MPTSSLLDSRPIKFSVSGGSNYYMDHNKNYIKLELKIIKEDGTNIDNVGDVDPVNPIAHLLFQQIDVSLNDVVISSASNLYHY